MNSQYDPSEVLRSVREPYNKNTLWIYPHENYIDIKIYDKGWKVLFTTEDKGLSTLSEQLVKDLVKNLLDSLMEIFKKQSEKYFSNFLTLTQKLKLMEEKIKELEDKIDKLTKRYLSLSNKINLNGGK